MGRTELEAWADSSTAFFILSHKTFVTCYYCIMWTGFSAWTFSRIKILMIHSYAMLKYFWCMGFFRLVYHIHFKQVWKMSNGTSDAPVGRNFSRSLPLNGMKLSWSWMPWVPTAFLCKEGLWSLWCYQPYWRTDPQFPLQHALLLEKKHNRNCGESRTDFKIEEVWQIDLQATININMLFCCQGWTWILNYFGYKAILCEILAELLSYFSMAFSFQHNCYFT